MIEYARGIPPGEIRALWKQCFNDPDRFYAFYFTEKYRPESTLVRREDGVVISLFAEAALPDEFLRAENPRLLCVRGVCTCPDARKKGYMAELLSFAFAEMRRKGIHRRRPDSAGGNGFSAFYAKFGFAPAFDYSGGGDRAAPGGPGAGREKRRHGPGRGALQVLNGMMRGRDMTVLKCPEDFNLALGGAFPRGGRGSDLEDGRGEAFGPRPGVERGEGDYHPGVPLPDEGGPGTDARRPGRAVRGGEGRLLLFSRTGPERPPPGHVPGGGRAGAPFPCSRRPIPKRASVSG